MFSPLTSLKISITLFAIGGAATLGYHQGANSVVVKWQAQKLADAKALQEQQTKLDAVNAAADTTYQHGVQDGKSKLENAIAQLNRKHATDLARMRQRATNTVQVTGPATAASSGYGEAQAGLPAESDDATGAFWLRLASEADQRVLQLNACQDILEGQQK